MTAADDGTPPEVRAFLDSPSVTHTPLSYTIDRVAGTVTVNGVAMDESDLIEMLSDLQGDSAYVADGTGTL